jgi:hypothetical protein
MDMKEVLAQRIAQLGYSQYRVTQEICKLRANGDEIPPVTRYNSSIIKALTDPQNVKFYVIEDLIKALGGEIIIRWHEDVTVD